MNLSDWSSVSVSGVMMSEPSRKAPKTFGVSKDPIFNLIQLIYYYSIVHHTNSNYSMSHAFPLTSWSDVQVDISCVLCSVTGEPSISEVVEVASVKNKYGCSPIDGLMESVVCSC